MPQSFPKALPPLVALAVFIGAFYIIACSKDPVSTTQTSNPNVNLELLFEHEGVKVYRFEDGGNYVYYTDARGKVTWQQPQGKITVPVGVETVGN